VVTTAVTVRLDGVQLAWLDAIADVHGATRADVLREALQYFAAKEHARVARTRRYEVIKLISRAERWDPITSYLCGRDSPAP